MSGKFRLVQVTSGYIRLGHVILGYLRNFMLANDISCW
jgi:hypothetical protein